jgi:hypothetical protein
MHTWRLGLAEGCEARMFEISTCKPLRRRLDGHALTPEPLHAASPKRAETAAKRVTFARSTGPPRYACRVRQHASAGWRGPLIGISAHHQGMSGYSPSSGREVPRNDLQKCRVVRSVRGGNHARA